MSREVEPGSSLHMVRINFDINVGSDALEWNFDVSIDGGLWFVMLMHNIKYGAYYYNEYQESGNLPGCKERLAGT
jgi:hypothetical protein